MTLSIIIINNEGYAPLKRSLEALELISMSPYDELLLVNGAAQDALLRRYCRALERNGAARVCEMPAGSSTAQLYNHGLDKTWGDVLLFLPCGTILKSEDGIEHMLTLCRRRDVGAVLGGVSTMMGEKGDDAAMGRADANVVLASSATDAAVLGEKGDNAVMAGSVADAGAATVTAKASVLMVRRETLLALGGFDDTLEEVGFMDEFCLRLVRRGLTVMRTPYAKFAAGEPITSKPLSERNALRLKDLMRDVCNSG